MSNAMQYLTLGLGQETFGIDIRHVREILDMREVAVLPQAPPFLLGLTDVRGRGVPVVDLRLKLGLPSVAATAATRIVILDVPIDGPQRAVGFVADRVIAVATLDGEGLEPPPEVGGRWRSHCLAGIGRKDDAFVVVLAIDRLMAADGSLLGSERPVAEAA